MKFLIKKKYQVHGIKRRTSTPNTSRIDHIFDSVNFNNKNLTMHHGDLSDVGSLNRIINQINPDEIYNLAAQSHVKISFQIPEYTSDVNALGPLRLLEIIKKRDNTIILVDSILFDNIIMLDKISKNNNILNEI